MDRRSSGKRITRTSGQVQVSGPGGLGQELRLTTRRRSGPVATAWVRAYSLDQPDAEPVEIRLGHGHGRMAVTDAGIWVVHGLSRAITRLEPETLTPTDVLRLGKIPVALANAGGALWVLSRNGWLWRVDQAEPRAEGVARLGRRACDLAADGSRLWAAHDNGRLTSLDPSTGEVLAEGSIGVSPRHLQIAQGELWATSTRPHGLVRIDPGGPSLLGRVPLPGRAVDLVSFERDVWALSWEGRRGRSGSMLAVQSATGNRGATHRLFGRRPQAAVAVADGILVASAPPGKASDTSIQKLDPSSGALRLGLPRPGWCVDQLAVTPRWVLATMSIGVGAPGHQEQAVVAGAELGGT